MILIGELSLWVALLMSAWSAITSFAGGRTRRPDLILSGERAVHATWVLVVAASLGLWTALFTHDFSFRHVAVHSSANLPALYLFASFWAGQAGSLLCWALILSTYAAIVVFANRARPDEHSPYVTGTLATVMLFLLSAMCFGANPYERLDWMPSDGSGLHPLMQSAGMVLHPPMLYLGYLATAIPFACAVSALLIHHTDNRWRVSVHRWSLIAWFFLTLGITLGMWWTYAEPGITGSWVWDAVKNGSIAPWLALSAFLLRASGQPEKWRWWDPALVGSSFVLAVLVSFAMPAGVIASVSSFSDDPVRGWFAVLFVFASTAIVALILTRARLPATEATPHAVTSRGRRRGAEILMLAGLMALLAGVAGRSLRAEHDVRLMAGQSFTTRDPFGRSWTFTSQGMSRSQALNRKVSGVALQTTRSGQRVGLISSEQRQYVDSRDVPTFEPSTEAGIRSSVLEDVYVVLGGVSADETAQLTIAFNPFVGWTWIGGALIAVAGMLLSWPARSESAA